TEETSMARLEGWGGAALVAGGGWGATAGRSGLVDAACRDAQIVGDHQQHWLHTVRGLERTPVPLADAEPTVREVTRAFARLVLHGEQPPVTPEDGARAVLIAEACRRAGETGTPVDVPALGPAE